jgi:hypothetical protein
MRLAVKVPFLGCSVSGDCSTLCATSSRNGPRRSTPFSSRTVSRSVAIPAVNSFS